MKKTNLLSLWVDLSTLIKVECSTCVSPDSQTHHEPRRWVILTTQAAIDKAEDSDGGCTVPTYQKNGRQKTGILLGLRSESRNSWERENGLALVHLSFIHNARTSDPFGCQCQKCKRLTIAIEHEAFLFQSHPHPIL